MAHSMTIKYLGDLRTENTHLKSGNVVITDAPTDHNGSGEAFSPTDLLCTSLAACALTLMGIAANNHAIKMGSVKAEITKVMGIEPRRVVEIIINYSFGKENSYTEKEKKILENSARTCPVAKSLNPEIKQNITFKYE